MATQIIRPDSDVSLGGWTDDAGGTTNVYLAIDEVSFDEGDYAESANNPALDVSEFSLSNPDTIITKDSDGHTINYRYAKSSTGGRTIELRVRLLQGAFEIASWTHTDISGLFFTANQTLSSVETALITDWDDLRLEFRGDTSGTGAARSAQVSWAEMGVNGTVASAPELDSWVQPTNQPVPDVQHFTDYTDESKPTQEPELVTIDKWFQPASQPVPEIVLPPQAWLTEPMLDIEAPPAPTPREGVIIIGGDIISWDDEVIGF